MSLLLTVGVILALFVFYEAFWTNLASGRLQDEAAAQLEDYLQDSLAELREAMRGDAA